MGKLFKLDYLHWYHWLVVFLSLMLTFGAWKIASNQLEEKSKIRFEFQSEQLVSLVFERMSRYEDALRSGVAAIHSQSYGIDALEWREFAKYLKIESIYPGINGIGVIYQISPNEKEEFLAKHRQKLPQFKIHPTHTRNEYWPITFVEPLNNNKQALGLDMAFEDNRFTAAVKAKNTGATQITAPIVLVQDSQKTPGFLQYVPFYSDDDIDTLERRQKKFIGHVYAPFIMNRLMQGTLEQSNRRLHISIYDGDEMLYDELTNTSPGNQKSPNHSISFQKEMYGRSWTFTIQSTDAFNLESGVNQPVYILIGGLIIDSLLLILFISLSRSKALALQLVDQTQIELKVTEQHFEGIVEAAPCGIIVASADGKILETNSATQNLFEYSKEELIGENIETLIPAEYRMGHIHHRTQFMTSPSNKRMGLGREVFGLKKSESKFPAEVGLALLQNDGNEKKVIVTIIDMTEHTEVNTELKRSNKDLKDFAYVASHDLKAPLRGIIQISTWIEEDIKEKNYDEVLDNIGLLKGRTRRLDKLLDDLLDYSRVSQKFDKKSEVDLEKIVHSIFELLEAPEEVQLIVETKLPKFECYQIPLEVVLRNIIGNAIKHSDKKEGIISISYQSNYEYHIIKIKDNGPGISPDYHEQIFELFKTLRPRDEVEGSGMGLSIVNKILEYQNGRIEVESEEGQGATFIVYWPK